MTDRFVYVTYIRTSSEKLWEALTSEAFTREYWWGTFLESDWKKGSRWAMRYADGGLNVTGRVLESDPPHRLVIDWYNEAYPELNDGPSRASFDIEALGDMTKLTVVHEGGPKLVQSVSGGWPAILGSLKSWIETGKALPGVGPCAARNAKQERAA